MLNLQFRRTINLFNPLGKCSSCETVNIISDGNELYNVDRIRAHARLHALPASVKIVKYKRFLVHNGSHKIKYIYTYIFRNPGFEKIRDEGDK